MYLKSLGKLSSVGAAIGTFLAELAVCVVIALFVKRDMKIIEYYILAVPFCLSGVIMFVCAQGLTFDSLNIYVGFALKCVISGVFYFSTMIIQLFVLKMLRKDKLCDDILSVIYFIKKKK